MEPFRPNRGPLKLSANMVIENLARVLDINPEAVASIADFEEQQPGSGAAEPSHSGWRMWSEGEAQAAAGGPAPVRLLLLVEDTPALHGRNALRARILQETCCSYAQHAF